MSRSRRHIAKYAGQCHRCHGPIAVGETYQEGRRGRPVHITCSAARPANPVERNRDWLNADELAIVRDAWRKRAA